MPAELVLAVALLAVLALASWLVADLRPVPRGARRGRAASVSVVVPARDEAASLPALLAALDALADRVHEVVVVDDGSRDRTAAVARAAGAVVVHPGPPEPGWTGKAWACQAGARAASGDLLLFLDADTVLAPDALDGLLALHERHSGLVTVQPYHRVERPYEHLSAYFNVVALMASGAFGRRPATRSLAFGPCLLTTRADYERAGGHAAVRGDILDDAALAAAYDRAGLGVHCAVGGQSVRMRSYPDGLGQLARGWGKNVASGVSAAHPLGAIGTALWICAHHAVGTGGLLAVVAALTGWDAWVSGHPALWAAGWVAVAAQLRALLRRAGAFGWWTWVLFPLPLLAFDLIFARSAALTVVRRRVRWRGREVDLRGVRERVV